MDNPVRISNATPLVGQLDRQGRQPSYCWASTAAFREAGKRSDGIITGRYWADGDDRTRVHIMEDESTNYASENISSCAEWHCPFWIKKPGKTAPQEE